MKTVISVILFIICMLILTCMFLTVVFSLLSLFKKNHKTQEIKEEEQEEVIIRNSINENLSRL